MATGIPIARRKQADFLAKELRQVLNIHLLKQRVTCTRPRMSAVQKYMVLGITGGMNLPSAHVVQHPPTPSHTYATCGGDGIGVQGCGDERDVVGNLDDGGGGCNGDET